MKRARAVASTALQPAEDGAAHAQVAALVRRARLAQSRIAAYTQQQADLLALAAAWAILEPVMRAWSHSKEVPTYPAGTWGSEEADELLERDVRRWRRP